MLDRGAAVVVWVNIMNPLSCFVISLKKGIKDTVDLNYIFVLL